MIHSVVRTFLFFVVVSMSRKDRLEAEASVGLKGWVVLGTDIVEGEWRERSGWESGGKSRADEEGNYREEPEESHVLLVLRDGYVETSVESLFRVVCLQEKRRMTV